MASGVPLETGPALVAEFKGYGVSDVAYFHLTREEAMDPANLKILDGVTAVWFSGGDQAKQTAVLLDTPLHKRMLELYKEGCLIGGTSAGAAVMSEFMITGNEKRTKGEEGSWEVIWADDVEHTEGFGFVTQAVIDQHFVTRRRHNRLIAVVLENPSLVGVGIEESTAVLVRPDGKYEVLGEGQVVVYDARRAVTSKSADGHLGGHGLTMHVLLPGDVYDLATGSRRGAGEMKALKLKLPHTLLLIYIMVVLTVVATWIIPGGEYQRVEKDGRTVPVAGSYHRVESAPQGLDGLFVSPAKGFVAAAMIIAIVFICGGAFNIIQKTGAITAVIHNLSLKFGESKALRVLFIPVTMILFSLGGAIWGMCEETMPFILIFVPLSLSLGYDTIVGVALPFVGAAAGFAGAFFNPFTVGIAQGLAGLPLYSGLGYRLIVWAGGTAIAIAVVMRYAARVRRDPKISPTYEDDLEKRARYEVDKPVVEKLPVSAAHKRVLFVFAAGFAVMIFGILKYRWEIGPIAGVFLAIGVFSGIVGKLSGDEVGKAFVEGAKDMVNAALIIGTARAILIVAQDGKILDTILSGLAGAISTFHPLISAQLMFVSQCVINFFVHSGTAQAALTIPIMAPLGDLVGLTRQTSVFAYQLAEYINPVLPTSGVTMGVLGLAGLKWEKWAKWMVPLLVLWVLFAALTLIPPVLMKWGPA